MRLRSYQTWKMEYLFVRPEQWAREHQTHFVLKRYEVLEVLAAATVLRDVVQRDPAFLAGLVDDTRSGSQFDKQRLLRDLIAGLGRPGLRDQDLPRFAWLYVARIKRQRVSLPTLDPWKDVREAITAAEQAPRGFIVVEAVSDAGAPMPNLRLELLLADGQVRSVYTNHEGSARAEPIPQGRCHVRVAEVDGSYWHAENGPQSQRVDRGRKRSHVVEQGECLSRIAHRYGIKDWKKVWNAPENDGLRKKRKDPNVLLPGDEITVPGIDVHEIVVPTDQTHRLIVAKSAELSLEVLLHGVRDEPLGDAPYVARYAHGAKSVEVEGQLDGEGRLTMMVPMDVRMIEVELIDLEETFHLTLGQLDPCIDAVTKEPILSGIQQRLLALGYGHLSSGELDEPTREALATFQRTELGRDDATGEPDAETCAELEKAYGV